MMNIKHVHWCICCILSVTKVVLLAQSFSLTPRLRHHQPCHHSKVIFVLNDATIKNLSSESSSSSASYVNASLLESLRSMKVKEIKSELDSMRVSTSDVFEKEELVQRLYSARIMQQQGTKTNNVADDRGDELIKKKKRRLHNDDVDNEFLVEESTSGSNDGGHNWSITTPFTYFQLGPSQQVTARNNPNLYIRPSPGKYASIKVQMRSKDSSSNNRTVEWMLLVDTACSGLVLSPNAVKRANDICPGMIKIINNAGTMTMAGSSSGGMTSVAKWDKRVTQMIVGGEEIPNFGMNGSNMAACQDIGALPVGLDGILGLSFLDQFACVDFDFVNDELRLDRTNCNPYITNFDNVVAKGNLVLTRLGIHAVDVILDGRGPVRMLVDTGAASTFLNRKGVADMKLSLSSSPQIDMIRGEQIGAMGADNVALQLTHRFILKRRWNLVVPENTLPCPGIKLNESEVSNIDIGELPVLETLAGDGVGGILGADLLMICDVVRFSGLNSSSPEMILMYLC